MPQPISIGTYTVPNILLDRLCKELYTLQKEGCPLNIDVDQVGELTLLGCKINGRKGEERETLNRAKSYISNCLADIIVNEWEARIIRKIVRNNFYYYSPQEKQIILEKAKEILNPTGLHSYNQRCRKEKILEKLLEYLDLNQELILEGFINFRLKDYQQELEEIVNSAVDEFLLEKEYLEFIRLLKYFVEIQEPRIEKVKVIFRNNENFSILDENGEPVQHESLRSLELESMQSDINYDDLLVSALITLAPREVEIHYEEGVEKGDTSKTILHVFEKRVTECMGCRLCRKQD